MNGEDHNRKALCDIARTSFEVVNRLLARDQLLARELRSSRTGSRQIYREECITIEMATVLRERFASHTDITLFTPPEEGRNGADWCWRFERGTEGIHAFIQAKRLQRANFWDPDHRGQVDIDGCQLQRLNRGRAIGRTYRLAGLARNIGFSDPWLLLLDLGFEERTKGSHHIFRRPDVEERINLQRQGDKAKPYQVRQVRSVILRYRLRESTDV